MRRGGRRGAEWGGGGGSASSQSGRAGIELGDGWLLLLPSVEGMDWPLVGGPSIKVPRCWYGSKRLSGVSSGMLLATRAAEGNSAMFAAANDGGGQRRAEENFIGGQAAQRRHSVVWWSVVAGSQRPAGRAGPG